MNYTIKDALDDARSWDIGEEAQTIARLEHLVTGEIKELMFTGMEENFDEQLTAFDEQGYAITFYNDENMFHRECSVSLGDLMTRLQFPSCS
jgi:hypothetical protein